MNTDLTADRNALDATDCPVLYSFRRCPYAMRARMGVFSAGISTDYREVLLRDKPDHMVKISPKATVPVLQLTDGTVLEESLDIMKWALGQNDPDGWLPSDAILKRAMDLTIEECDRSFKFHLDRYKYPNRYDNVDPMIHREAAMIYLTKWQEKLEHCPNLFGEKPMLADYAIFPFVRQFANVDKDWFDAQNIPQLQAWLERHISSDIFLAVMEKHPVWQPGDPTVEFPW